MTHDENALLLSAYRADPSIRNRNRVVVANMGLVKKAADRFSKLTEIPFGDLCGAGYEGLIKATTRYDPGTGCRFSSFAMPYIRGAMMHYRRDKEQPGGVKIPRAWIDNRTKILAGDLSRVKPEDRQAATQAVQYHKPASLDHSGGDDDGPAIQLVAPAEATLSLNPIEALIMPFVLPNSEDYFNATAISLRYRRQICHWRQLRSTIRLVREFEKSKGNGKPAIIVKRGRNGETWIHRDLSAAFLQWVSPETEAAVCYAYSQAVQDRLAG